MAECLAWPRRHSDACSLQGYRYGRKFSSAKCATVCVLQPPTSNVVLFTDPVGMRPSEVPRKWRYRKLTRGRPVLSGSFRYPHFRGSRRRWVLWWLVDTTASGMIYPGMQQMSAMRVTRPSDADTDRKSTRLNSSHLVISY